MEIVGKRLTQDQAFGGRLHGAVGADEEGSAELFLKRGDMAADGGLRHADFPRGGGNAAVAHHGLKRDKGAQRGDLAADTHRAEPLDRRLHGFAHSRRHNNAGAGAHILLWNPQEFVSLSKVDGVARVAVKHRQG